MLDYSKRILEKVSFDKGLFGKELRKSIKWIKTDEQILLKLWCLATFGHQYQNEIMEAFGNFG